MKYIISIALAICLLSETVKAQKGKNFIKIHGGLEIPISFFGEGYKTGWGISVTDYYGVSDKGNILLTVGVTGWNAKDADLNSGLLLIKAGYQQFVAKGFYLQPDAGIAVYTGDWGGSPHFTFAMGTGYLFKTDSKGGLDISTRFNRIPNRSWISFNIGYQFKL